MTRIALSLTLLLAGFISWMAAGVAEDLAVRYERLATFGEPPAAAAGRWTRAVEGLLDRGGSLPPAAGDYWRGKYAAAASADRPDADLMVAANAMFRQAQSQPGPGPISVERLDRTLQAYAAVLKNAGFSKDAAYNYEFVARLRDATARSKPARQPSSPRATPAAPDDLPAGPTIHGRPGEHPPDTRGDEFEVLTPMDYGEREAQPEPTPGRPLPRKG
jgi:hypothetical protein